MKYSVHLVSTHMERHLDRLFTQAMAQEAHRRREDGAVHRRVATGGAAEHQDGGGDDDDHDDAAAAAAAAVDPTAAERLLDAFKRKDYAACLGLPAVTLDSVGKPHWPVTDTCVAWRLCPHRRAEPSFLPFVRCL